MKIFKIIPLSLALMAVASCSTPKAITYFQDLQP